MNDRPVVTIGIDARAAVEVQAGRGRLVRELLRALAERDDPHHYLLYARQPWLELQTDERFAWHLINARDPWWHMRTARAANRECDVFLSSNSYLTGLFMRTPAVPIVHDMIAFEPTMHPNRRSTIIERLTLGPAVRKAPLLLCTTQATADALIARFPRAAGRIAIAPLAATPPDASELGGDERTALPPAGFVLAVGTLEPRKNLPRLIEAYSSLDNQLQQEHPLVVVGALGWKTGETLRSLQSLGSRCLMLGHVSDAALAELYRRCAVFCYPSLGEGFGLPVLEAMSAGAPVLTSDISSMPEVGGDAAAYADPRDIAAIARELGALLRDETRRAELSLRGPARASEFSWARFARDTLQAVLSACP
ncbi:MAG TPA: glycosyltransferase family 1 protein [Solirubrobacteraceae bacterium]|nr:glycosyltransferase family 1 protein [Solirubrobacteraceae bacterium]